MRFGYTAPSSRRPAPGGRRLTRSRTCGTLGGASVSVTATNVRRREDQPNRASSLAETARRSKNDPSSMGSAAVGRLVAASFEHVGSGGNRAGVFDRLRSAAETSFCAFARRPRRANPSRRARSPRACPPPSAQPPPRPWWCARVYSGGLSCKAPGAAAPAPLREVPPLFGALRAGPHGSSKAALSGFRSCFSRAPQRQSSSERDIRRFVTVSSNASRDAAASGSARAQRLDTDP